MGIIQRQGIKNTIITYIGILIGFANVVFIQPRFLKLEELGLIRVLYSFSAILATFLPLGVTNITIRFFPHFKNRETRHYGFFGLIMLFLLVGLVVVSAFLLIFKSVIVSWYIKESKLFTDFFNYVIPLCFFVSAVYVFTIYCQSFFKSTIPSFINDVLVRLLSIIVVSLYYIKFIDLQVFVIFFVAVYGFQALSLLIYIYTFDSPGYKIDKAHLKNRNLREMIKYGALLSITAFASLGVKLIDTVMLGMYLPLGVVGIYSVAAFMSTIIEVPIGSLERISNSKIADEFAKNRKEEVEKIYKQSTKYLILIGGLLLIGVVTNIKSLFELLPETYAVGINVVYILSVSAFFNMLTGLNGSIIFNSEHYKFGSLMLFILLFLIVMCNTIFIPLYGFEGAAIATALSSFVYNLLKYLFIWHKFKMQPFDRHTVLVLIIISATFMVNWLISNFSNPILNIFIHSVAVTVFYVGLVYYLNIVPEFHHYFSFLKKSRKS